MCKRTGSCSLVDAKGSFGAHKFLCSPASNADCKQSDVCKDAGRCRHADGACVK
jgi:hypothetical protein